MILLQKRVTSDSFFLHNYHSRARFKQGISHDRGRNKYEANKHTIDQLPDILFWQCSG